jgi:uncharacterized protein
MATAPVGRGKPGARSAVFLKRAAAQSNGIPTRIAIATTLPVVWLAAFLVDSDQARRDSDLGLGAVSGYRFPVSRSTKPANETRPVGGLILPPAVRPRRGRRQPPPLSEVARQLEPVCRKHGITRLDIFGSVARSEARVGSDVDLIATFSNHPGLNIVSIEAECAKLLGVPVQLLTSEAVAEMTNPYRKESIQRDRRTIYGS